MKNTRKSLFTSLVTLLLCSAMFVGSTFAWFTDTVSNTGNRIQAGTLDVDLLMYKKNANDDNYSYQSIADTNGDIFKEATNANNSLETLWEPGKTQVVYLAVKNKGNLALKHQFYIDVLDHGLCDDGQGNSSLEYVLVPGVDNTFALTGNYETVKTTATSSGATAGDVMPGRTVMANDGILDEISETGEQNETEYFALIVHMKEDAGNAYQGKDAVIDVYLTATQYSSEKDGFGNPNYDAQAQYEDKVAEPIIDTIEKTVEEGKDTVYISSVTPSEETGKQTIITVPKEVASFTAGNTSTMTVTATPTVTANNTFTISSNGAVGAIDLKVKVNGTPVTEFKDSSEQPVNVKVETYVAKNLTHVSLSFNNTETWTQVDTEEQVNELGKLFYDKTTGRLVYLTSHFSTFVLGADEVAYVESKNTAYLTLGEAVDAAEGEEIDIIKNINTTKDGFTIESNKLVKLDLNGRKIYADHASSGQTYVIKNQGTLVVNDSSKNKTGQISIDNGSGYRNDHVLYLEGGSTTTINGGRIVTEGYYPVYVVQATEDTGKTTFTMNNGYISGGYYGLYLNGGNSETSALDATVNGGTIVTTFYVNQCRNWYKSKYDFNVSPPKETLLYYTKEYEAIGNPVQTYYFTNLTIKDTNIGYNGPFVSDEYIDEKLAEASPLSDYYINNFGVQPTVENTRKIIVISCNPVQINVSNSQIAKISILNSSLASYSRENENISSDVKTIYNPADYQNSFAELYPGTTQDGDVWIIKK